MVAQFKQDFLSQHFTVVLAARLTALPVAGNLITHGYILIEGILKPSIATMEAFTCGVLLGILQEFIPLLFDFFLCGHIFNCCFLGTKIQLFHETTK